MTEFLQEALRELSADAAQVLERLVLRTSEVAREMNITARKSEAEIVFFHLADSLTLLPYARKARRCCDVGTGGGFPGLVLACLCPDTQFTLVDATKKKIDAIEQTVSLLGLRNVTPLVGRAEELGRAALRERNDLVVSRALAPMEMLGELCLPLTSVGGTFVAMKGLHAPEEVQKANRSLVLLGAGAPREERQVFSESELLRVCKNAPDEQERGALAEFCAMTRVLVVLKKERATPKGYPRSFAKIKQSCARD